MLNLLKSFAKPGIVNDCKTTVDIIKNDVLKESKSLDQANTNGSGICSLNISSKQDDIENCQITSFFTNCRTFLNSMLQKIF